MVLALRDVTGRKRVEEVLRARARQQALVAELGRRALTGIDLGQLMEEAVNVLASDLGVEYVNLLELLPDGTAVFRAGVGWRGGRGRRPSGTGGGDAGRVILDQVPVLIADLRADDHFPAPSAARDHGVVSSLTVPLYGQARPLGVLGVHAARPRRFPGGDVHFEQAHGGTLFLDEIGDMTPLTQAKILRVLQGQEFERVGGSEPIRADVRVIATPNRDLMKMVADGSFRADLYYRLNVFTVHLPPLRDRDEDLPLLVEHFVRRFGRELDRPVREVSPEAMEVLRRYPWPGNVRELQSVVKQALLATTGPVLLPEFLPPTVRGPVGGSGFDFGGLADYVTGQLRAGSTTLYADCQGLTDRHLLTLVLRHAGGNLSQASRSLGITRATLRARLAALGIPVERPARPNGSEPA